MKKVLCIFGTRPEAIKMAPVIRELKDNSERFSVVVCVTGQHRGMLDQVLDLFDLQPDYDLNLMKPGQELTELTSRILLGLDPVIKKESPDLILVQGDTTTAMAAALAGFYNKVTIGHVEAGLRTGDKCNPFPEETNRKIIDSFCDLYFAPTEEAKRNLLNESVASERIAVTGNTVIDALHFVAQKPFDWLESPLSRIPRDKKIILATTHRRENFGAPLRSICAALKNTALRHPEIHLVIPVHPNPNVHDTVLASLGKEENVSLLDPLDYASLVQLLKECVMVVTDSGGLQEEAPAFGKPVLVLRETSERPEGITAGVAKLVGTDTKTIETSISELLSDQGVYQAMARAVNPYGDGNARKRIVSFL